MIKLFLTDLDGTLLDSILNIKEEDLKAIDKLREHNIDVGIVTGRDLGFYFKYVKDYFDFDMDYIGNNGATLCVNNEKLYETHIGGVEATEMVLFMQPYLEDAYPFVADEACCFYYPKDKPKQAYWKLAEEHMSQIGPVANIDLLSYLNNPKHQVVKISFWTREEDGSKIAAMLSKQFGDRYEISITAKHFVEVTAIGNNKGTTIQKLMDHLNLTKDEIAVIGDGENDIPMLKMTKHAFVMENAKDEIKQYGRIVGSVAEAIEIILEENL